MRPLIGIPCYATESAIKRRPVYATNQTYIRAIEECGGVPVLLPAFEHPESLAAVRGRLDGLLLTGGGDVDPVRYGEPPIPESQPPDAARDALELELTEGALREGLPILGICRGMQVLNIACGGTLYQDIGVQLPGAREHELGGRPPAQQTHRITIAAGSRLAAILGTRAHTVNSFHHQAVSRPGRGVAIVAHAPDGVAEALELPTQPFALAVQFHPELRYQTDERLRRLFQAFVQACQAEQAPAAQPASALS